MKRKEFPVFDRVSACGRRDPPCPRPFQARNRETVPGLADRMQSPKRKDTQ